MDFSTLCTSDARVKNLEAKKYERLVNFLMGLNDDYCASHGDILMNTLLQDIKKGQVLKGSEDFTSSTYTGIPSFFHSLDCFILLKSHS